MKKKYTTPSAVSSNIDEAGIVPVVAALAAPATQLASVAGMAAGYKAARKAIGGYVEQSNMKRLKKVTI